MNEEREKDSGASRCSARFFRLQPVKFPLGDGTYQDCTFIGVDSEGVATVKTKGGRYRTIWDCNRVLEAQRTVAPAHGTAQKEKTDEV